MGGAFQYQPLKPLDLACLLAVALMDREPWSYATLAGRLHVSASQLHSGLRRCRDARLIDGLQSRQLRVDRRGLLDLLTHGVRYVFPAGPGPRVRGLPTVAFAPPLSGLLAASVACRLVWPDASREEHGQAILLLYPKTPAAAAAWPKLYESLALVDGLRVGGSREQELSVALLKERLGG